MQCACVCSISTKTSIILLFVAFNIVVFLYRRLRCFQQEYFLPCTQAHTYIYVCVCALVACFCLFFIISVLLRVLFRLHILFACIERVRRRVSNFILHVLTVLFRSKHKMAYAKRLLTWIACVLLHLCAYMQSLKKET